eukprot:TRINITY_DN23315_c0_g1_i1.p1 TRINITY_DN23315_c0_g1~~TRINITY_DN23315_c0_g1_i1.p1  ORF type:complete len:240 (+),score=64.20 TRINITY_DN23315_c0_g1_i1:166-885(+)
MDSKVRSKYLVPLEANPEVILKFVRRLGFPETAGFFDVFGMDEDLLAIVPQPVLALLLVYPITPAVEAAQAAEAERITKEGQTVSPEVWFTRQTIGNMCGTIGLLHCIGNNLQQLGLDQREGESYFERWFRSTASLSPAERAKLMEDDVELERAHSSAASEGDTAPPPPTDPVDLHFVAFVVVQGHLYELDGCKPFPVCHGAVQSHELLQASVKVIREFMDRNPESLQFNLIAMSAATD